MKLIVSLRISLDKFEINSSLSKQSIKVTSEHKRCSCRFGQCHCARSVLPSHRRNPARSDKTELRNVDTVDHSGRDCSCEHLPPRWKLRPPYLLLCRRNI